MKPTLVLKAPSLARHAAVIARNTGCCVVPKPAPNPTLVAHGLVAASRWHLVTAENTPRAVADLYVGTRAEAHRIARLMSNMMGKALVLLDNQATPAQLKDHIRHHVSGALGNPARSGTQRVLRKIQRRLAGPSAKIRRAVGAKRDHLLASRAMRLAKRLTGFGVSRNARVDEPWRHTFDEWYGQRKRGAFKLDIFEAARIWEDAVTQAIVSPTTSALVPAKVRKVYATFRDRPVGNPTVGKGSPIDRLLAAAQAAWDRGDKAKAQKLYEQAWSYADRAKNPGGSRVSATRRSAGARRRNAAGGGDLSAGLYRAAGTAAALSVADRRSGGRGGAGRSLAALGRVGPARNPKGPKSSVGHYYIDARGVSVGPFATKGARDRSVVAVIGTWPNAYLVDLANDASTRSIRDAAKRELAGRGVKLGRGPVRGKIGLVPNRRGRVKNAAGDALPIWEGKYLLTDEGFKDYPNLGRVRTFTATGRRGATYGAMVYPDGRFHWLNLMRRSSTVPFDLAQIDPTSYFDRQGNPSRTQPRFGPHGTRPALSHGGPGTGPGRAPGRSIAIAISRDGGPATATSTASPTAHSPTSTSTSTEAQTSTDTDTSTSTDTRSPSSTSTSTNRRRANARGRKIVLDAATRQHLETWLRNNRTHSFIKSRAAIYRALREDPDLVEQGRSWPEIERLGGDGPRANPPRRKSAQRTPGARSRSGRSRASARNSRATGVRSASGRTRNPGGRNATALLERGKAAFRKWQDRGPIRVKTFQTESPTAPPKVVAELGKLHALTYETDKYDGKTKLHEHVFDKPYASVVTDPEMRDLFIVRNRSRYGITPDGIIH